MLLVIQIVLLIFMVLFFLSGMGRKDNKVWVFMITGCIIALMLFGSVFMGGIV